jgi:hypothetical protein
MSFAVPNRYRVRRGPFASTDAIGNNGKFFVQLVPGEVFQVIASDGLGWEHVSCSLPHRTPTWDEMCRIKALFWSPEDCVVQYHPPASQHVNVHPYCLHLWRPTDQALPQPPRIMVG